MLQRDDLKLLNGQWEFVALESDFRCGPGVDVPALRFTQTIEVPFAPETPASGLNLEGFVPVCAYRRYFSCESQEDGFCQFLHFEAVDYSAWVWINGRYAGTHEGGYSRFSVDITPFLQSGAEQEVVVLVRDDPFDMAKPRGKQDWQPNPHSIWYPRTTGIWQSVWLERVADAHISRIAWEPNFERWEIGLRAEITAQPGHRLQVVLTHDGQTLACDEFVLKERELHRVIRLPDPGIDDARAHLMWSPDRPTLIDAELKIIDAAGRVVDHVRSYTALRSVSVDHQAFLLNGRPCYLRMVLDQGYWRESGLTPPGDEAIQQDIRLVKAMGFNGVRKHQKIESERFLYWADKLGLLVWEELPSAYTFTPATLPRLIRDWTAAIQRDASHPCIVAWVPINESWGVPNLPESEPQRHAMKALYYLTRSLDPTRPVIGNDGWEMAESDIYAVHDYCANPDAIAERYDFSKRTLAEFLRAERPGHRVLVLADEPIPPRPLMLTEFGGIALSRDADAWGYSQAQTPAELCDRYSRLLRVVRKFPSLAGFCYTQFTDTYQESNGLLDMDRNPKFALEMIRQATAGEWQHDEPKEEKSSASNGSALPPRKSRSTVGTLVSP